MNFELSAEIYVRLANVTRRMPENVPDEETPLLRTVRLERTNGHEYALSSNRKIMAIYYMGKTNQPDGVAHVIVNNAIIEQCEKEKAYGSKLNITAIPEIQTASLKTTLGYIYPGNAAIFPVKSPLDRWKLLLKDDVKEPRGAMSWHLDDMIVLNASSPSGIVRFPDIIDATMPVVLRDLKDDNWMALFMSSRVDDDGNSYTVEPAKLPAWFK